MTEENSEQDVVETLRSKAGETDISQYLKTTLGGYTKRSVHEYLGLLRKQRQSTADIFFRNQQVLFEEKEKLRKLNENLNAKLSKIEEEYRGLSDSKKIEQIEGEELTPGDAAVLKGRAEELEQELRKSDGDKKMLEKQLGLREKDLDGLRQELERAQREKQPLRELIKTQAQKERELSAEISRLAEAVAERDEEIKFLNACLSEGRIAELNKKVGELTEQLSSQAEMISAYNCETELRQRSAKSLTSENENLRRRVGELKKEAGDMGAQNEKLTAECRALTDQLGIEYRRFVSLIKERSDAAMGRLEAERKLGEAGSKLTLMELEMKKRLAPEKAETDDADNNAS